MTTVADMPCQCVQTRLLVLIILLIRCIYITLIRIYVDTLLLLSWTHHLVVPFKTRLCELQWHLL
jgi:hypothetical protein